MGLVAVMLFGQEFCTPSMGLDLNTCAVAGCSEAARGVGAWLGLPLVIENTEYEFRQTCIYCIVYWN
jgi:hypothetical protein